MKEARVAFLSRIRDFHPMDVPKMVNLQGIRTLLTGKIIFEVLYFAEGFKSLPEKEYYL